MRNLGLFTSGLTILLLAALLNLLGAAHAFGTPGQGLWEQKISGTQGGFTGVLGDYDGFGRSVAAIGDLDGDGVDDLAAGAYGDDDGVPNSGAVWVLTLDGVPTVPVLSNRGLAVLGASLLCVVFWVARRRRMTNA